MIKHCNINVVLLKCDAATHKTVFWDKLELEAVMMNLHLLNSRSHEKEQKPDFGMKNKCGLFTCFWSIAGISDNYIKVSRDI